MPFQVTDPSQVWSPSLSYPSPLSHHPKGNDLPTQVLTWQGKLSSPEQEKQFPFPYHEAPHPYPYLPLLGAVLDSARERMWFHFLLTTP